MKYSIDEFAINPNVDDFVMESNVNRLFVIFKKKRGRVVAETQF